MRIEVRKILSLETDGAICTLLILDQSLRILLDCGLSRTLNIQAYLRPEIVSQLKRINLALISNSSIQYSGAYPFLIEEIGLNPHLFYTTQNIMRYSPLNLHEEILNLRYGRYSKRVFNKIYSYYEEMSLVKPQQKKELKEWKYRVIFVCYPAGGTIGSVVWRVSCGLVSLVYLAQHTNYSLNHISGLDLERLKGQSVHVLLTVPCPRIDEEHLRQNHLTQHIHTIVTHFYDKHKYKQKKITQEESKLLLTCYPNEMLIELMVVLRKVLSSLQENVFQIVGVCHVSSRYLELVKSQSIHFSDGFKASHISQGFKYERSLQHRVNIATANAVDGLLNTSIKSHVEVHHIGSLAHFPCSPIPIPPLFSQLHLFREEESIPLVKMSSQMDIEQSEGEDVKEEEGVKEEEIIPLHHAVVGQYISSIGFPHFLRSFRQMEEEEEVSEYGLRYHVSDGQQVVQSQDLELQVSPAIRNSSIQIMNTVFRLETHVPVERSVISCKECVLQRTGFDSSVKIIKLLAPREIVIVGGKGDGYQGQFHHTKVYELQTRRGLFLQQENELVEYRMNYLPQIQYKRIQKVEGVIERSGGSVTVVLRCVEEEEIFEFRMEEFYLKIKGVSSCLFTGEGLSIDGILLQRNGNELLLQGDYSPNYFKIRRLLYQFLGIY